jgi:putative phosphoesterase
MKIALIGDVHANLPALEAVLEHAHQQGAEEIWNVGDFVGYGAFPDEVVRRLREIKAISIIGNYDLKVLKVREKAKKWKKKKAPEKWLAFQWAYQHLSKKSRKYLRSLPKRLKIKVKPHKILLVHGSPASIEEHLTPETPYTRLQELARSVRADVIVCGHSHQPFVRQVGDVWFINTGSVGRPDDGDPRACYALLEFESQKMAVTHYRVEYDQALAAAAIRAAGLPEDFAQMVLQGKDLEAVRTAPQGHPPAEEVS